VIRGILLLVVSLSIVHADDWPQWLGPKRDGIWRETGILQKFPAKGPTVRWRTPIGAGYSGPAVAGNYVFITDRKLTPRGTNSANPFDKRSIPGVERIICLSEKEGKVEWDHTYDCPYNVSYPAGPRATPVVSDGKLYTLGTEGHLFCFDAATGKKIWSRQFKEDFGTETPLWGFAAHPLLDGNKLICMVGGIGSVVVAFNKENGKELWRALGAREPGYCPPVIYTVAGKRQLIIWHPESVNALDPETGEVFWTIPFAVRSGLSIPTPRQQDDRLFITCFYNGSLMLRLTADRPGITELWRRAGKNERNTEALQSIMSTPFFENEYVYGVCSYGQLRCIKASNGDRVWETFAATTGGKEERWANAFLVKHADRFFLANEKGDLIIAQLTPDGYHEISRAHLLEPTNTMPGREVVWSHPAFANRSIYARNDKELICVSLAE